MITSLTPAAPVSQETLAVPLRKDLNYFADAIGRKFYETTDAVFEVADLCAEAMEKLGPSDRQRLVGLVRFSKGTISKMVRISQDERLRTDTVRKHLPSNYTTLYEISHLSDAKLAAAIADGVIRPDMRRADLAKWSEQPGDEEDAEDKPDVLASIRGHASLSESRLAVLQENLRIALIGFPEIEIRGKGNKWSFQGVYRIVRPEAA